jgi:hypothetical protein
MARPHNLRSDHTANWGVEFLRFAAVTKRYPAPLCMGRSGGREPTYSGLGNDAGSHISGVFDDIVRSCREEMIELTRHQAVLLGYS